jgi:hypothetical protein
MHSGQQQVGAFWFRKKVLPILFQATQAAGCTAALQVPGQCDQAANSKFESL